MILQIKDVFLNITIWDIIDMAVIAYIFYKLFMLIRHTRAEQLIKGIIVLVVATWASDFLKLYTVHWLLKNTMTVGVIALLIVFQPELRRALEILGRGDILFGKPLKELVDKETSQLIDELAMAVQFLAKNRIGGLIVLERETGIEDILETGISLDAKVTSQILTTIFTPGTPLHDGAVVIRDKKLSAAGCLLPLTENPNLSKELGTRHRAGLGISEISDAIAIIVSEETGVISMARSGRLSRYLDAKTLKEILVDIYKLQQHKYVDLLRWRKKNGEDNQ